MIAILYIPIVFQLVERIALVKKSIKAVLRKCGSMLGFSYTAKGILQGGQPMRIWRID